MENWYFMKVVKDLTSGKETYLIDNKRVSQDKFEFIEILCKRWDCVGGFTKDNKMHSFKTVYTGA